MNDLEVAIKKLQRLRGLKENGRLDDQQTLKLLDVGRCGVPDFGPADVAKRKRRYNVHGTVWEKKVVIQRLLEHRQPRTGRSKFNVLSVYQRLGEGSDTEVIV